MKKIVFMVEKTNTGFSAFAKDDNINVGTTGTTITELKSNILEALNLLNERQGKRLIKIEDLVIELDLPQFFDYYKIINAKALAQRIGMNQSLLAQYVGGQKKPSLKQVERIISGVKEAAKEILELEFA
jgi:transcriptional regulator with XRE-family HTH domain